MKDLKLYRFPMAAARFKNYSWDDPQSAHRAVMSLFPEKLEGLPSERRATSNILFRTFEGPQKSDVLLSATSPLLHTPEGLSEAKLSLLLPRLTVGTPVYGKVLLNAVKRKSRSGSSATIPVPSSEAAAWAKEKLSLGFSPVEISTSTRLQLGKKGAGGNSLAVALVEFYGVVAEPQIVQDWVVAGIGRARAYGCGLLSLRLE